MSKTVIHWRIVNLPGLREGREKGYRLYADNTIVGQAWSARRISDHLSEYGDRLLDPVDYDDGSMIVRWHSVAQYLEDDLESERYGYSPSLGAGQRAEQREETKEEEKAQNKAIEEFFST